MKAFQTCADRERKGEWFHAALRLSFLSSLPYSFRDELARVAGSMEVSAGHRWLGRLLDVPELARPDLGQFETVSQVKQYASSIFLERAWGDLTENQVRRGLVREWRIQKEAMALHLRKVDRQNRYCSDLALKDRTSQRAGWDRALAKRIFRNSKTGEEKSLLDLVGDARRARVAELYAFCLGIQEDAHAKGMRWVAITLTAPPTMHPNPTFGHQSWDGTLPHVAHEFLKARWRTIYKRLKNADVQFAGLRVTEPHKDGCPHWHVMIYADPVDIVRIKGECERVFSKKGEECEDRPSHLVYNDQRSEGASFATYLLKYILKAVGKSIDSVTDVAVDRVDAWRATWGIRGYQFFGVPSFSAWRALRRVKECPEDPELMDAWLATKGERPDVSKYFEIQGGICQPRYKIRKDNEISEIKRGVRAEFRSRLAVALPADRAGLRSERKRILAGFMGVKPTDIYVRNFSTDQRTAAIKSDWEFERVEENDTELRKLCLERDSGFDSGSAAWGRAFPQICQVPEPSFEIDFSGLLPGFECDDGDTMGTVGAISDQSELSETIYDGFV